MGPTRELNWEDFETVGIIILAFLIILLVFVVSFYLIVLGYPFLVIMGAAILILLVVVGIWIVGGQLRNQSKKTSHFEDYYIQEMCYCMSRSIDWLNWLRCFSLPDAVYF